MACWAHGRGQLFWLGTTKKVAADCFCTAFMPVSKNWPALPTKVCLLTSQPCCTLRSWLQWVWGTCPACPGCLLSLSSFLPFSWLPRYSPSCHDHSFCFRAQVGSPLFLHSDKKGKFFPYMLIIRDLVPVFPFKNILPKVQLFFIRHTSPPHNALLHFNTNLWNTSWSFQIPCGYNWHCSRPDPAFVLKN